MQYRQARSVTGLTPSNLITRLLRRSKFIWAVICARPLRFPFLGEVSALKDSSLMRREVAVDGLVVVDKASAVNEASAVDGSVVVDEASDAVEEALAGLLTQSDEFIRSTVESSEQRADPRLIRRAEAEDSALAAWRPRKTRAEASPSSDSSSQEGSSEESLQDSLTAAANSLDSVVGPWALLTEAVVLGRGCTSNEDCELVSPDNFLNDNINSSEGKSNTSAKSYSFSKVLVCGRGECRIRCSDWLSFRYGEVTAMVPVTDTMAATNPSPVDQIAQTNERICPARGTSAGSVRMRFNATSAVDCYLPLLKAPTDHMCRSWCCHPY